MNYVGRSVALEIIEGFLAIQAAIHGFAGSGSKLADQLSMVRVTPWTGHCLLAEHFGCAKLLLGVRWRYAECFELLFTFFTHPVSSPGR